MEDKTLIRFERKDKDMETMYGELSDNEKKVLHFMLEKGAAATVKELHGAFPEITVYRLRPAIYALVYKNFIRQVGNGPKTRYELTEEGRAFEKEVQ